jgi:prepilin-type N-terminal cleavage/methylation domain-containing protein
VIARKWPKFRVSVGASGLARKLLSALSVRALQRGINRGFTLVEMMVVVAITGLLATVAVYGVNKYIQSSKSTEAIQMIGAIKAAQEQYRIETYTYKDVSGTNTLTYYPQSSPTNKAYAWGDTTSVEGLGYRELGVSTDAPVRFVYGCAAGLSNNKVPTPAMSVANWPATSQQPWYVVQALGDFDADGVQSVYVSSSFTSRVFADREGE